MKQFILVLAVAAVLAGQTLIDLKTQTKRIDFSAAQSTKPIRMGSALPPTCSVGELYLLVPAATGKNLYSCVASNVWVQQGGGAGLPVGTAGSVLVNIGNGAYDWRYLSGDVSGGSAAMVTGLQGRRLSITPPADGDTLTWNASASEWVTKPGNGNVTVQVDGVSNGSRSIENYLTGAGMVISASDTGSAVQIQHSIDTAAVQTRANAQSGADLKVTLTSSGSSNFTGDMNPALVSYVDGMVVQFRPNHSCSGNPDLNLDGLGARRLYESDGATSMTCEAGTQYAMWYDANGSGWRKYAVLPSQSGKAGKYLKTDGSVTSWADLGEVLPPQTAQSGKYLTTNGASASWADALPPQSGNAGRFLTTNGSGASWTALTTVSALGITIDGGGSTISTGDKGYLVVPFACTIESWAIVADQAGSMVLDVWKSVGIPTAANTITSTAKPTLFSAQLAVNQPATGWNTAVSAGDVLGFNVDSASAVTRATLTIGCRR